MTMADGKTYMVPISNGTITFSNLTPLLPTSVFVTVNSLNVTLAVAKVSSTSTHGITVSLLLNQGTARNREK
jgi:hypothetical protein